MEVIELSKDNYDLYTKKIKDQSSVNFASYASKWWDEHNYWIKFPPLCLVDNNQQLSYLFYSISKSKEYLTIHYLLTEESLRGNGYAFSILKNLFEKITYKMVKRFQLYSVSSSLGFYNKLGLEYLGVNHLGQYYCNFKMPHNGISGITQIVKESSLDDFTEEKLHKIYKDLQLNGEEFNEKNSLKFQKSLKLMGSRYHFDDLETKVFSF